jgi:hypothetical protein
MLRFFAALRMTTYWGMAGSLIAAVIGAGTAIGQAQEQRPIVFAFDVNITLSDKAAARLKMRHESIVVSADYSGEPKKDAMGHANEIGMINLGVENIEVIGAEGLVRVTGTKIDIRRLDWIKGPVMLNVNVYSGRHASENNILACDFFDGSLSSAVRKTPVLHCSLIEEGEKTEHRR